MDAALANRLAASVRAADPDRYFSALFAPFAEKEILLILNYPGCAVRLIDL